MYIVGGSDGASGVLKTASLYSPVAVTLPATEIKFNAAPTTGIIAKLNGRVTTTNATGANGVASNTNVSFDFGTTTRYGSTAAVAGTIPPATVDKDVNAIIGVLACGSITYHYRVKTVTAIGTGNANTIYGSDQTFITLPCKTTDLKVLLDDTKGVVNAGDVVTYTATVTNLGPAPDVVAGVVLKAPMVGNLTATSVACTTAIGGAKCPTVANTTIPLLQGNVGIIIPELPKSVTAKVVFTITAKVAITALNGSTLTYAANVTAPSKSFVDNNLSNNTARDVNRVNSSSYFPDLIITGITINPASPAHNTAFSAVVTVKNQGTAAITLANGVYLDVWANHPATRACGANDGDTFAALGTLAVGDSKSLTVSMTADPIAGNKVLRAFVDSSCLVTEFDDTNNQAIKNYTVR